MLHCHTQPLRRVHIHWGETGSKIERKFMSWVICCNKSHMFGTAPSPQSESGAGYLLVRVTLGMRSEGHHAESTTGGAQICFGAAPNPWSWWLGVSAPHRPRRWKLNTNRRVRECNLPLIQHPLHWRACIYLLFWISHFSTFTALRWSKVLFWVVPWAGYKKGGLESCRVRMGKEKVAYRFCHQLWYLGMFF